MIFDLNKLEINRTRANNFSKDRRFLIDHIEKNILADYLDDFKDSTKILHLGQTIQKKSLFGKNLNIVELDQFSFNKDYIDKVSINKNKFEHVCSNLEIHFINDIKQYLFILTEIMLEHGVLVGSFFGGLSMIELRSAFIKTEDFFNLPHSPHTIPFIDIKVFGKLLQDFNFKDIVLESDVVTIEYSDFTNMVYDLRAMSLTNIMIARSKKYLGKRFFSKLEDIYKNDISKTQTMPLTFEIITFRAINSKK